MIKKRALLKKCGTLFLKMKLRVKAENIEWRVELNTIFFLYVFLIFKEKTAIPARVYVKNSPLSTLNSHILKGERYGPWKHTYLKAVME